MSVSSKEQAQAETAPKKRTARNRATRKVAKKATTKRAARKAPARRVADDREDKIADVKEVKKQEEVKMSSEDIAAARKAPTKIGANQVLFKRKRNRYITVTILLLAGTSASAAVGFSDPGRIDVYQTIEERNERIRNGQASENDMLSGGNVLEVQDTTERKVDGGLIPARNADGSVPEPPKPKPIATNTATSTLDFLATSTASTTAIIGDELESESNQINAEDPDVTDEDEEVQENSGVNESEESEADVPPEDEVEESADLAEEQI